MSGSKGHLHFDRLVRIISTKLQIFVNEVLNIAFMSGVPNLQGWKGSWLPLDLLPKAVNMIIVNMGITKNMHKVSWG